MAIWNGTSFVFRESAYSLFTIAQALHRWGFDMFRLKQLLKGVLEKWMKLYEFLADKEHTFTSVDNLLDTIGLKYETTVPLNDYLIKEGLSKTFVDELVTAVTRVQYGQNTSLNALVGLVAWS